jgi:hypothetical protein
MALLKQRGGYLLGVAAALVFPVTSHAHPGHGTTPPDSPAHVLEPVHFVPLLAGICVIGLLGGLIVHRRRAMARAQRAAGQPPTRRDA